MADFWSGCCGLSFIPILGGFELNSKVRQLASAFIAGSLKSRLNKPVDNRNFIIAELRVALQECYTGEDRAKAMDEASLRARMSEIDAVITKAIL